MRRFLSALAILFFGLAGLVDSRGGAAASAQTITVRSFLNPDGMIARESLAIAEGENFTDMEASDFNTPTTLGGVQLMLDGVPQRLRTVTATRVIFIVDAVGAATRQVALRTKFNVTLQAQIEVVNAWPGLFVQSTGDDPSSYLPAGLWTQDPTVPELKPISSDPLPVGPALRPTQVTLNGSGWRFAAVVQVRLNGIPCEVLTFGPFSSFPGQDELVFLLPPRMAGAGPVDLSISVAGREANYARLVLGNAVSFSGSPSKARKAPGTKPRRN